MYPNSDPRAEQFNEALERRLNGDDPSIDDPELKELVQLAARLDDTLPEDLPDPAFREELKQQLLTGAPVFKEPVDLAGERWRRRLAGSPWRASAVAAAFTVVVVVAVVLGMGPLGGGTDDEESEPPLAFQEVDDETEEPPADVDLFTTGETRVDGDAQESEWISTPLPPFDTNHIVLNPLLAVPLGMPEPEIEPVVEFDDDAKMPEMPGSAMVYYLSSPPNPEALIRSVQGALGLEGEYAPGDAEEAIPDRLVNEDGQAIIEWHHEAAFFHYLGENTDPEFADFSETTDDPAVVALDFLETIGFDLYSIDYVVEVDNAGNVSRVRFEPASLPEVGLDLSLGALVVVDEDLQVHEAMVMWFSLTGQREVTMVPAEEARSLGESGEGFWPPHETPAGEVLVEVLRTQMIYLLTRYDEATFVLQPAVKFIGRFSDDDSDEPAEPARYYVAAVESGD